MNNYFRIPVVFLIALVTGCGPEKMDSQEYLQWYSDSKSILQKQKIIGDYIFDIQYKPSDLMLAQKLVRMSVTGEVSDTGMGDQLQYIDLTIDLKDKENFIKAGSENEQEYYAKQYYFSFGFQQDIYLEEGAEKIPCVLYHYERSYDLKSAKTFVLGFPKNKSGINLQDKVLVIDSQVLPTGTVRIRLEKENFKKIPQLIAGSI